MKNLIVNYFVNKTPNCFIIASPSGGLHIYLNKSGIHKRVIDRISVIGIPSVDYLSGDGQVIGPDTQRSILHTPKNIGELDTLPRLFEISFSGLSVKQEANIYKKHLPIEFPYYFNKGHRRVTSLLLIRMHDLSDELILELNK